MQRIKNFFNQIPTHLIVAASAWISRLITALIGIISIRTLLLYLGEERYAVYVIVYSLIAWFNLCDLGIGPALQNFISECRTRNENYNRYLKAALQIISILFIIFFILLFLSSNFIKETLLANYLSIDTVQNFNIILIIGSIMILTIFANIVYRVFYAVQKGYISNILPAIASIISMISIVIINRYYPVKGNILIALMAFTLPQLLAAAIPFIKVFKPVIKDLFTVNYDIIKELMTRALKFSGLAIMGTLALQIDYIVMSQTVNPTEITTYNILSKFFALFIFIHTAILLAAWPVFSELNIKSEFPVIKKMIFKYILFGFAIIFFGTCGLYIFSDVIIGILAPTTNIKPTLILFIMFAVFYFLRVWSDTFATFLQSINVLKIFWIYMPVQALISMVGQYFLSLKFGIYGILLGLIFSFVFTSCIVLPYKTYKVIKSRDKKNEL